MANGSVGSLPGLAYEIDRRPGMSCLICHATDRALFLCKDDLFINQPFGICEPCSLAAHWAWRQLSGEIPPGFPGEDLRRVSTVFALIARRKEVPRLDAGPGDEDQVVHAPAELNSSWEFLLDADDDGTFAPPSISLDRQPDLRDLPRSALAALSASGLVSWPALVEPLFTGYSPRGRLVSVVLIRGWAFSQRPDSDKMSWRSWPLSAHTGPMAGFWRAMETVWALRLHKHCVVDDGGELCVQLREAACRYIELQIALRSRKSSDSSMSAIYRSSMSADELAADRLIQLAEERAGAGRSLATIPREAGTGRPASIPSMRRGSSVAPWDDPSEEPGQGDQEDDSATDEQPDDGGMEDGSGELGDPEQGQDGDDPGDSGPEDPSFVRPRRPLRR